MARVRPTTSTRQRHRIEDEFNAIWNTQAPHRPTVLTDDARKALHRVLFFQRPLKTPEVGLYTFARVDGIPADERRLPKAHPLFQQRRLLEEINNLRNAAPGEADRTLSLDQRDLLIRIL